jgi:excisionase family DNA binding protein
MQPYNSELFLTTSEVADLFDVHPSTVKRWSDTEGLEVEKTEGGHRRIYLRNALSFAEERGIETFLAPFAPFESHVWLAVRDAKDHHDFKRARSLAMGWLLRGYPRRVTALFHQLVIRPELPLELVCDRAIQPFMAEIGTAWREGRLRIGEEHMASQAVLEALIRLSPRQALEDPDEERGGSERPPVAVVGAAEGDQHQIGSMCIRVLLEREGWQVLYPGANTPAEEFAALQRTRRADLICVSVSPPATEAHIRRAFDVLREFYRAGTPYHLVFGGSEIGEIPELGGPSPFRSVEVFRSAVAFIDWVRSQGQEMESEAWAETA